jgi:hypothetical protein
MKPPTSGSSPAHVGNLQTIDCGQRRDLVAQKLAQLSMSGWKLIKQTKQVETKKGSAGGHPVHTKSNTGSSKPND